MSIIARHFGIAPLTQPLPPGLETLTLSIADALALEPGQKPYWSHSNGWVTIITDDRAEEVAKALKEHTPSGRA